MYENDSDEINKPDDEKISEKKSESNTSKNNAESDEEPPVIIDLTQDVLDPDTWEVPVRTETIPEIRENTAKYISLALVIGFLILLFTPYIILCFCKLITVQEVIDIQTNISAVLGGILGSVVGYYFRSIEKE